MKTTTGIPQSILQTWSLPPGWDKHVKIYIANSDYSMGEGDAIVLASTVNYKWTFSVPAAWLPAKYQGNESKAFTDLSNADFVTALTAKVVGVGVVPLEGLHQRAGPG